MFPVDQLCEGDPPWKCQDRTDESFCECGQGKWKCLNESTCINSTSVCDDHCDCVNCTDEDIKLCFKKNMSGMFTES